MEAKTKKYLTYGGIAAGVILVVLKLRGSESSAKKTKPVMSEAAIAAAVPIPLPVTTGQYTPVNYPPPQTYNPYPTYSPPPYTPPYGPQYQSPFQTTLPYTPVYPQQQQQITPAAICQSVVGSSQAGAVARLRAYGILVSVNGRQIGGVLPYSQSAFSGIQSNLTVIGGVVRNAVCSAFNQTYQPPYPTSGGGDIEVFHPPPFYRN